MSQTEEQIKEQINKLNKLINDYNSSTISLQNQTTKKTGTRKQAQKTKIAINANNEHVKQLSQQRSQLQETLKKLKDVNPETNKDMIPDNNNNNAKLNKIEGDLMNIKEEIQNLKEEEAAAKKKLEEEELNNELLKLKQKMEEEEAAKKKLEEEELNNELLKLEEDEKKKLEEEELNNELNKLLENDKEQTQTPPVTPPVAPPVAPVNQPKYLNTGFRETIINSATRKLRPQIKQNLNLCPAILTNGKKLNEKNFIPSQFPNLTKIKPIIKSIKPQITGGRKTRKNKYLSKRKSRKNY